MTAATPAPDDVSPLLDGLEKAHAAIQPPVSVVTGLAQDDDYPTDVNVRYADGGSAAFAECYGEESAALIVAAVNHLPALVAAVRAGLALADAVERKVAPRSFHPAGTHSDGASQAFADAASRLRTALTAPLTGTPEDDPTVGWPNSSVWWNA